MLFPPNPPVDKQGTSGHSPSKAAAKVPVAYLSLERGPTHPFRTAEHGSKSPSTSTTREELPASSALHAACKNNPTTLPSGPREQDFRHR